MCFGYDGERALRDSLDQKGASRRALLRGAAGGAAGAAVLAGATAPASAHGHRGDPRGRRAIPHERISIQMYTLRDATGTVAEADLVLTRLAQYGLRAHRARRPPRTHGQGAPPHAQEARDPGLVEPRRHQRRLRRAAHQARERAGPGSGLRQRALPQLHVAVGLAAWADQMNAEAAVGQRYGLRYGYHNHAHEFTIDLGGGVTPWEVLTSRLDPKLVHLEVDLYWAYTGGVNTGAADPRPFAIDVIHAAPQRVRQFHVKDRDGDAVAPAPGDMCDLGTGVVDFRRIFRATRWRSTSSRTTPPTSPR